MAAMQRSCDRFHLLDLISQADAVQTLLVGRTLDEKIAWLAAHGKLSALPIEPPGSKQGYWFESNIGMKCTFFFDGDDLVIVCRL